MTDLYQIRRKCAYVWDTLPSYVYQNRAAQWRNFESEVATLPNLTNPVEYYRQVNDQALVPLSLSLEEICLYYVVGNQRLHYYLRAEQGTMFQLQDIVGMDQETYMVMNRLWNRYDEPQSSTEMIQQIKNNKTVFRYTYEREEKEEKLFQTLIPVPFREFELDTIVKTYEIQKDIVGNIYALFNQIKVDPSIPLIVTPRFYKVLKGYDYAMDIPDDPDTLYLFTTTGKVEITQNKENRFELSYNFKQDEDDSDFLQSICNALGIEPEDVELKSERLNGLSHYPRQTLSNVLWRDFVMNHPQASKYLAIDEHNLGTRRSKSTRQVIRKGFYMFYFEGDQRITFTIREDDENEGVRVRILNAFSMEKAALLLITLAKMFTLYNQTSRQTAQIYNTILGSDVVEFVEPGSQIDPDKPTKLKKIAKGMFLPNYTRKCGFLPDVVPNDVVESFRSANVPIMRFPKEGDEVDGKFYHFVCNHHEENIFPGLRKNPLENNNIYPLLPCCYTQDQSLKRTSAYKEYYNTNKTLADFKPKEKDEVVNIQYRYLISDKFVGFEQTGKCPEDINNLFRLYTTAKPFRKGVHRSRQSALECILLATQYENFSRLNSNGRLRILSEQLDRLRQTDLTICTQECWDIEDPQLYLDADQYLNPRYLIRLLETVYNCRIVLLSRTDFIHPNFIQGHLRWKPDLSHPVIILFEHYGSEADEATYPQCEWIQIETPTEKEQEEFERVYEAIFSDYVQSLETILPKPLPQETDWVTMFQPEYTLIAQHIDFYGKVYAVNVEDSVQRQLTLFLEQARMPILQTIPRATVGYYSPRISSSLGAIRKQIQIDDYTFFIYNQPQTDSLLDEFEQTREQVELLVENAKQVYAKRLMNTKAEDSEDSEDWSFIVVDPQRVIEYSKYLFSDSEEVFVPNVETRERLIFSLRVYATRFRNALMQYPGLGESIPFQYRTIRDFEEQENAIIMDTSTTLNWFADFYDAKPLDGTLYNKPFVAFIQDKPYKCNPLSDQAVRSKSYLVHFPQIKKTFKIGNHPNQTYLVIKNLSQILKWYSCEPLY